PKGAPLGSSVSWLVGPRYPDVRRSLWEFDNHRLNSAVGTTGGSAYIIPFPIWCALVPFLILPVIWWRKRPRPSLTGFPIEPANSSVAARSNPVSKSAKAAEEAKGR